MSPSLGERTIMVYDKFQHHDDCPRVGKHAILHVIDTKEKKNGLYRTIKQCKDCKKKMESRHNVSHTEFHKLDEDETSR